MHAAHPLLTTISTWPQQDQDLLLDVARLGAPSALRAGVASPEHTTESETGDPFGVTVYVPASGLAERLRADALHLYRQLAGAQAPAPHGRVP